MKHLCPVDALEVVGCRGRSDSDILVILSHPDWADVIKGVPFALDESERYAKTTSGSVMQRECIRAGIDLNMLRCCVLWPHKDMDDERCMQENLNTVVLKEARNKRAILLVGAQAVKFFTGYNVDDVNGLQVSSPMLSAPIIYPLVNPSSVLIKGAGVGEIRFGLEQFAAAIQPKEVPVHE
jgi:uracil-DNA glycosylase